MLNSSFLKNKLFTILLSIICLLFVSCDISVSNNFPYQTSANLAIIFQFIIVLLSDIILGGGCLFAGIFLCYKGLTGNAVVMIELNSIKATIINCTPGMFLIIAGIIIIYMNKFNIRLGVEKNEKSSINVILIILVIVFILFAIGLCVYGAYIAHTNDINWFQKI